MIGERDDGCHWVNDPPDVSVSKLVRRLKGISSRLLRKAWPDAFEGQAVRWEAGYTQVG